MLRFSGMPAPSRPLLQADNYLLGNVPHDELCHIAINDSMGNPAGAGAPLTWDAPADYPLCENDRVANAEFDLPASGDVTVDALVKGRSRWQVPCTRRPGISSAHAAGHPVSGRVGK